MYNNLAVEQDYQEALNFLYSFVDHSMTRNLNFSEEKFNLDNMRALLSYLNNPHFNYPVIHIAGTKGKGSTAAMIASILQSAGCKVGLYTSPHLQDFCERIQINQVPIPKERLVKVINQLRPITEIIKTITTFELTTAAGFLYFSEEKVDVAVIEVGLGGRLDSTNLVTPTISVITSISLDHVQVLGDTVEKIAAEKAGIIKNGIPVIVSHQTDSVMEVIKNFAEVKQAPIHLAETEFSGRVIVNSLKSQVVEFTHLIETIPGSQKTTRNKFPNTFLINLPLLGRHQIDNAVTVLSVINVLIDQGYEINEDSIKQGFDKVLWPGRFEVLRDQPPIIIDSAHNRDSAKRLRSAVDDYLKDWDILLIVGFSEDKDIQGFFEELAPRVDEIIATESFHPRAYKAEDIVTIAQSVGMRACEVLPLEKAFDEGLRRASNSKALVATGSIFIAAGIREEWNKLNSPPIG